MAPAKMSASRAHQTQRPRRRWGGMTCRAAMWACKAARARLQTQQMERAISGWLPLVHSDQVLASATDPSPMLVGPTWQDQCALVRSRVRPSPNRLPGPQAGTGTRGGGGDGGHLRREDRHEKNSLKVGGDRGWAAHTHTQSGGCGRITTTLRGSGPCMQYAHDAAGTPTPGAANRRRAPRTHEAKAGPQAPSPPAHRSP